MDFERREIFNTANRYEMYFYILFELTITTLLLIYYLSTDNKKDEDVIKFAELVGQNITPSTKSIWYPEVQITRFMNKRYIDEEE